MSLQHQVRALVGGEAAREADGQRVGLERAPQLRDDVGAARRGARPAAPTRRRTMSMSCDLQRLVRFPQLAVVDRVDALPERRRRSLRVGQSGPRWRS